MYDFFFIFSLPFQGKLSRCPTPYPKEMKEKMRHMKNLATLQQISVSGHENRGFEKDVSLIRHQNCYSPISNLDSMKICFVSTFCFCIFIFILFIG